MGLGHRALLLLGGLLLAVPATEPTTDGGAPSRDRTVFVNDPRAPEDFAGRWGGDEQHRPSIAWCGRNVVVVFDDRGGLGWAASGDSGATFTDKGAFPRTPAPDGTALNRHAALRCTNESTFYVAGVGGRPPEDWHDYGDDGIAIQRSDDGGRSFGPPVLISTHYGGDYQVGQPSIAVDPGATSAASDDVVHVAYRLFADYTCGTIVYGRSVDGGQTWGWIREIEGPCDPPIGFVVPVAPPHVAVNRAGDVFVAWVRTVDRSSQLRIRRATWRGAQWQPVRVVSGVTPVGGWEDARGELAPDLGGLAVDRSGGRNDGNVYLAWEDGRAGTLPDPIGNCVLPGTYCRGDIFVSRSTDDGSTWSSPTQVNTDRQPRIDQRHPAIVVDSTSSVWTAYFDNRRDPRNRFIDVFIARSSDAGRTWTERRITATRTLALKRYSGPQAPETIAIASQGGHPSANTIAVWDDTSLGDMNIRGGVPAVTQH